MALYDNSQFRNFVKDIVLDMFNNGEIRGDGVVEIGSDGVSVGFSVNEEELQRIIQETQQQVSQPTQDITNARFL